MTTPDGLLIRATQPLPTAYPWLIHPPRSMQAGRPPRDHSMSSPVVCPATPPPRIPITAAVDLWFMYGARDP